ncbi:uncharacterized protein [Drosophila tropicalis]|uniref:uncharacterized protein n=1 Tax=Drosophila tropicalis TaxID=46794 RepID=UPI0035AB92AC
MFRFYKLYSLYSSKMAKIMEEGTGNPAMEWCLCEKLPRALLHIPLTRDMRCEVCGLERRARHIFSSSSSSDEEAFEERQKMLLERRRAEEACSGPTRVKVAMKAKKPPSHAKTDCNRCGALPKPNGKVYAGRFGHYPRPKRLAKREVKIVHSELKTAPPPSSPTSSPPLQTVPETISESPNDEDIPNLVALAHEVFKRPAHQRTHWPSFYGNLFVSDFIPLDNPITDPSGGAISKRRHLGGQPLRTHRSRPLPPLAKVLSDIATQQKKPMQRAKGGGLEPEKDRSSSCQASQFTPYDVYEGPSEDSLIVNSASFLIHQRELSSRTLLNLPPSLSLSTFDDSQHSSDTLFQPTAPPLAEQSVQSTQNFHYLHGRHIQLDTEARKAVSQAALLDNSSSSSSSSESSIHLAPQHTTFASYHQKQNNLAMKRKHFLTEEQPHEETETTAPAVVSILDEIFWTPMEKSIITEHDEIIADSPNNEAEMQEDKIAN